MDAAGLGEAGWVVALLACIGVALWALRAGPPEDPDPGRRGAPDDAPDGPNGTRRRPPGN